MLNPNLLPGIETSQGTCRILAKTYCPIQWPSRSREPPLWERFPSLQDSELSDISLLLELFGFLLFSCMSLFQDIKKNHSPKFQRSNFSKLFSWHMEKALKLSCHTTNFLTIGTLHHAGQSLHPPKALWCSPPPNSHGTLADNLWHTHLSWHSSWKSLY